jgi:hypothetical protein
MKVVCCYQANGFAYGHVWLSTAQIFYGSVLKPGLIDEEKKGAVAQPVVFLR